MGWDDAVAGIGTGVITMIGHRNRERRAVKNQMNLMNVQKQNQKELDTYGQQLQMKTWKETNYPAQMKMLREAGLNPGLIYGMSGGGGVTTGSQGGGSAQGGSAPAPQPMELGNAIQAATAAATIELNKALAKKAEAEATNLGAKTEETQTNIKKLIAETTNVEVQTKLKGLEADLLEMERVVRPYQLQAELDNVAASTRKMLTESNLTEQQTESLISEAKARAATAWIGVELAKQHIELTTAEKTSIYAKIAQDWVKIAQEGRSLDQNDTKIAIDYFKAELEGKYPGLSSVLGSIFTDFSKWMNGIDSKFPSLPELK